VQAVSTSDLLLQIGEDGGVSALINASPQGQGVVLMVLPIALDPQGEFRSASDVHVARLSTGNGYTILVVSAPTTTSMLKVEIRNATRLSETPDGKGKLEFDISFPFMAESEKNLLALPFCIRSFDTTVVLPKKYDERDAFAWPSLFVRRDDKTFTLDLAQAQQQKVTKCAVVFPNPMQHAVDLGKLLVGGFFGIWGISLAQASWSMRERKSIWIWIILLVSLLIVVAVSWFTYRFSEARRVEFLIFAIPALISSVYAVCVCVYVLFAKKFQTVIGGQVNLNDVPTNLGVQVELYRMDVNPPKLEASKKGELKGGRYVFHLWRIESSNEYQVVARYTIPPYMTVEGKSLQYPIPARQSTEIPVINLTTPPITASGASSP
jgi:hypothetical protein